MIFKQRYREVKYEKQNGLCHWCGKKMSYTRRKTGAPARDFATFEHLKRKDRGGDDFGDNIVLAHYKCNIKRNHEYQTTGPTT